MTRRRIAGESVASARLAALAGNPRTEAIAENLREEVRRRTAYVIEWERLEARRDRARYRWMDLLNFVATEQRARHDIEVMFR